MKKRGTRGARARRLANCENLEARYLLTGTGFAGNDCPPDLDLSGITAQTATVGETFTLDLGAMGVVTDVDSNGDPTGDTIRFVLDPDVPEETPEGAAITPDGLFSWTPTTGQVGMYDIVVIAIDAGDPALADAETFSITVVEPLNSAPELDLNGDNAGDGFAATFIEDDPAVSIVDSDLTILDMDDATLMGATVTITNLQDVDAEFLSVAVGATNITAAYDETTGVLTLSGEDTVENYQTVLRTLTYANMSDTPNDTQRQITVVVNDGTDDSNVALATVDIVATNDPPNIAAIDNSVAYVGVPFEAMVTVTDPDSSELTVILDDESPDTATITRVGDTDVWLIEWTPTEMDGDGPFLFRVIVTDGGTPVAADTEAFVVTLGNPLAQADLNGAADGVDFTTSFTEDGGAIDAFAADLTVADPTDTELEGATITITNIADGADEVLTFDVSNTGITGMYDSGVLTLTGTDSLANYEAVLRSVRYENLSDDPTDGDRTVEVSLDDGTDFGPISTSTITVTAENDAPELTLPNEFGDPNTPVEFTLGDTIVFTANVQDPDNGPAELTFMLDLDNAGIGDGETLPTIDQDGEFDWEPSETGTFVITVIVTDGLAADTETFTVQINTAPPITSAAPHDENEADSVDVVMAEISLPSGEARGARADELLQDEEPRTVKFDTSSVSVRSRVGTQAASSRTPHAKSAEELGPEDPQVGTVDWVLASL